MNIENPISSWMRSLPGTNRPLQNRGGAQRVRRLDLIGVDMAPSRTAQRSRILIPAIVAIVIAALFLVGLRMDVLRMSYANAHAVSLERKLLDEKLNLTVQLLRLRDPKLLKEQAARLGFSTPDRVIMFRTPRESDPSQDAPPMGAERRS